jgi:hypothetical protein
MYGYLTNVAETDKSHSLRRYRRWIGFAAVALLAAGWGGVWLKAQRRYQPPHARQQYRTLHDKAAAICSALGSSCELDPRPIFSERRGKFYPGDHAPLRMWKFFSLVDGRPNWMIFNDTTGGLCYLISIGSEGKPVATAGAHAITTSNEAAEAGFQRLKTLKLLGQGALVALHAQPRLNSLRDAWVLSWAVKANAASQPYAVRMELDRVTGQPLSVVDTSSQDDAPHL